MDIIKLDSKKLNVNPKQDTHTNTHTAWWNHNEGNNDDKILKIEEKRYNIFPPYLQFHFPQFGFSYLCSTAI